MMMFTFIFRSAPVDGQGFDNAPLYWPTPVGGWFYNGSLLGYIASEGSAVASGTGERWKTVDINGDGNLDLVVTSTNGSGSFLQYGVPVSPHWRVYYGNGTGFNSTVFIWPTPVGGQYSAVSGHLGYLNTSAFSNGESISENWQLTDINNDQKPDLVVTGAFSSADGSVKQFDAGITPYWKVYLNSGNGFSLTPINWSTPLGGQYTPSGAPLGFGSANGSGCTTSASCQSWFLSDMDGDHLPDLVIIAQYNTAVGNMQQFDAGVSPYYLVYQNTGNGFSNLPLNWPTPVGGRYAGATTTLGYENLVGLAATYDSSQSWIISDANGDNKPDLIVTGHYSTALNNGVQYGLGSTPHWRVFENNGSGFNLTPLIWTTPAGGWNLSNGTSLGYSFPRSPGTNFYAGSERWFTRDLDGDRRPELIIASEFQPSVNAYEQFGLPMSPYWKVYYNHGNGFHTWPIVWSTPFGGLINSNLNTLGFVEDALVQFPVAGSQGWSMEDFNGDQRPDLCIYNYWNAGFGYPVQYGVPSSPIWQVHLNNTISLSITEMTEHPAAIVLYPNPARDYISILLPDVAENIRYTIYDTKGQAVIPLTSLSEGNRVNLRSLLPGLYVLKSEDLRHPPVRFIKE